MPEPGSQRREPTPPEASGGVLLRRRLAAIKVPSPHIQLRIARRATPHVRAQASIPEQLRSLDGNQPGVLGCTI